MIFIFFLLTIVFSYTVIGKPICNQYRQFGECLKANNNVCTWSNFANKCIYCPSIKNKQSCRKRFKDVCSWSGTTCMDTFLERKQRIKVKITDENIHELVDQWCSGRAFNIGQWDVSRVTNMSHLFESCTNRVFTIDKELGSWDVSKVTDMSYMFANVKTANPMIEHWDIRNVRNMSNMFANTSSFDMKTISLWDTSNVIDKTDMI